MSAFDENPFAVSFDTNIQCGLYLDANLLQDPSVQQAAASSGQTAGLEDYDPFNKQKTTSSVSAAGGQPAVMSPTQEAAPAPPPQYTQTAQQQATAADFQVRKVNWLMKSVISLSLSCTNVKHCFDIPRLQELQVVQNKHFPWRTLVHSGRLLHSYYRFFSSLYR